MLAFKRIAKTFGLHRVSDVSVLHLLSQKHSPKECSGLSPVTVGVEGLCSIEHKKLRKGPFLMNNFGTVTGWNA